MAPIQYNTIGALTGLNTGGIRVVAYRSVPYHILPFSFTICPTLAVSRREVYLILCLRFTVFPLKKSKAGIVSFKRQFPKKFLRAISAKYPS